MEEKKEVEMSTLETEMYETYTRIWPHERSGGEEKHAELVIGNQSFRFWQYGNEEEIDWYRKMVGKALANLLKLESYKDQSIMGEVESLALPTLEEVKGILPRRSTSITVNRLTNDLYEVRVDGKIEAMVVGEGLANRIADLLLNGDADA